MQREIKFRGKRVDNGEWVYGYYSMWQGDYVIFPAGPMGRMRKVLPESVGQYTGLKDRNGVEAYEKDLSMIDGNICEIKFGQFFTCGWEFDIIKGMGSYPFSSTCKTFSNTGCKDFEIIGNTIDNPELIKP